MCVKMMPLAHQINKSFYQNFIRTSSYNSQNFNAFTLTTSRRKSTHQNTNTSKQNTQNALKLDPSKKIECPPPPPSNNSTSSSTPSNDDKTKYFIAGGIAVASIAGFIYYKNFLQSPSDKIGDGRSEPKIPEKIRFPESSKDIPKHIPYLLIGGGTASFAAFRAIKSNDAKAKVLVVSDEMKFPYMRPPLSKEIWADTELGFEKARFKQWNGAERSLYYEPDDFYLSIEKLDEAKNGGVSVIRGYTVTNLNVKDQKVRLDDGTEITYDKCLIATGSVPKKLDVFERTSQRIKEKIFTYKTIKDFEIVKKQVEQSQNIAIVGNGFLGSELACALSHFGKEKNLKVYQLFPESGNMAKVLPEYLSKWSMERMKEFGVEVMPESQITDVSIFNGNQLKLSMSNGKSVIVDFVIQAVGSVPNVDLAKNADLEIDENLGGFVVNAELEARSNLYAAGDVACFYDPKLGRRRVEHHDHAVVSGRLAGENMVGLKKPYKHQSMFWSDLGVLVGYEAIGIIDSSLPTESIFAQTNMKMLEDIKSNGATDNESKTKGEETNAAEQSRDESTIKMQECEPKADRYDKGIVFYKKNDKIVGILLWNVFNRISIARKILSSNETYSDLNEVAKLFDIFEQHHQDKEN